MKCNNNEIIIMKIIMKMIMKWNNNEMKWIKWK